MAEGNGNGKGKLDIPTLMAVIAMLGAGGAGYKSFAKDDVHAEQDKLLVYRVAQLEKDRDMALADHQRYADAIADFRLRLAQWDVRWERIERALNVPIPARGHIP